MIFRNSGCKFAELSTHWSHRYGILIGTTLLGYHVIASFITGFSSESKLEAKENANERRPGRR